MPPILSVVEYLEIQRTLWDFKEQSKGKVKYLPIRTLDEVNSRNHVYIVTYHPLFNTTIALRLDMHDKKYGYMYSPTDKGEWTSNLIQMTDIEREKFAGSYEKVIHLKEVSQGNMYDVLTGEKLSSDFEREDVETALEGFFINQEMLDQESVCKRVSEMDDAEIYLELLIESSFYN